MAASGQRVSIFDVARRAGVGVGTVSRVLNGGEAVSTATRERVVAAIDALGYHPSRLASGLSRGRSDVVAVVVPFITSPSVVVRLEGILEVLDGAGLNTVLYSVGNQQQRDRHLAALGDRHEAAGVIVVSIRLSRQHLGRFLAEGTPLSLVDTRIDGAPSVEVDNRAGGAMAARHLLDLGHRAFGFIGDIDRKHLGFSSSSERLEGFASCLDEAGVPRGRLAVRSGIHSASEAIPLAASILSVLEPPTAIFAASDTQASGVLSYLESQGMRSPEDVALVGFDGLELSALLGISTVAQPLFESGVLGAQRLLELLAGEVPDPGELGLPLQLVPRSTTIGGSAVEPVSRSP